MANANFYLKNPATQSETPINLVFRYNGKKLKYSTGEKIHPKFWNEEKQRAKKSLTGSPELNSFLSKVEDTINTIYSNQYSANGIIPAPEYLREELNKKFQKETKEAQTFVSLFEQFIQQSQTTKRPNTIKRYKTSLNFLRLFSQRKKVKLSFENINVNFYERFVKFLIEDCKQTNNTVGGYVKNLKVFLYYATENKFNHNLDFRKFKVFQEEPEIISLTEEELNKLSKMDLSNNIRLERVRDLFLFGCYTSLRFSDIENLKPENIKKDFLVLHTQKTKDNRTIPLNYFTLKILKKYENKLPVMSNQKMNDYLKELCKMAGIDEPTQTTNYRGGMRFEKTLPKYQHIGTHTARRTFVTLSLEKGMRAETVMEITGHKTYKSFKRYVSVTDKVKQIEMNRIWSAPAKLKVA